MQIPMPATQHAQSAPQKPGLAEGVQRMMGVLWYDMLSAMNQSGLTADTLGTGGGNFQSLFLWHMAEQDFGQYDRGLTTAALPQIGGAGAPAPALPPLAVAGTVLPAAPLASATAGAAAKAATATAFIEPLRATSGQTGPADLVTQARRFAQSVWPEISAAAQALDVPPVAVLAQAALETGWGSSVPGNNLFGIKAADGQPGISSTTHELVDGVLTRQTADFRSYADLGSAISDYVGLIRSGFAGAAGQASVAGFAQALQNSGYATDPAYAAKLTAIADSPLMRQALQVVATPAADADANATPNPNPTEAGTR